MGTTLKCKVQAVDAQNHSKREKKEMVWPSCEMERPLVQAQWWTDGLALSVSCSVTVSSHLEDSFQH
jgi:hypothetical protein